MSSSDSDEENTLGKPYNDSKLNKDYEIKLEKDVKSLQVEETHRNIEEEFDDSLLPSDIEEIDYIYYPVQGEDVEKMKGGKWLMFAEGDLDKIDHRWIVLRSLIENGMLVRIKSSTAFDTEKGVTMCYTSDSNNEEEVRRAADEIRKLINYEYLMFYKTNEASASGHYIDAGKREISIYMHTCKGGFYKRDKYNRWTSILK